MMLVLPSAALTVRFLTRRFIGEYGDMGECQARARPVPLRTGVRRRACLCPQGVIACCPLLPFSGAVACSQGGGTMAVFVQ